MRVRRIAACAVTFVLLTASIPSLAAPPTKKPVAIAVAGPVVDATVPPEAAKLIDDAIAKAKAEKFSEAVDLLQQALAIIEKKLGKDHYLLGNALNLLTQIERILGHLDVAEKHAERAISVLKKDINADPRRLGHALIHRAELHGDRGEANQEIELRQLTVQFFEKAFGPESTDTMFEVLGLARALRRWGRYVEAKSYFERWMLVVEKKFGPNEPVLVDILIDFANNEAEAGRYADAEKLLLRALGIRKTQGLTRDQDVEVILNNLAEVKYQQGDYSAAEALFERVLAVYEAMPHAHPRQLGILLGNLGSVHIDRGDSKGGVPLLRRSLEVQEKHFGSDSPEIVSPLTNLGEALLRSRQYSECMPYLERALAIREKALGPNHPRLAAQIHNVGSIWLEQGDEARAEPYFQRVLTIQEKALGTTNPLLFPVLQALGMIEQGKKRLDKAEAYHQRAVDVLEKSFGPTHPNIVAPLRSLAAIQQTRANLEGSRKLLERASEIAEKTTAHMLAGGSEAQKLAWLSTLDPLWEQIVDHHLQFEPKNEAAARLSFDATLRRKGRALDAVAGSFSLLRRSMEPDALAIFEKLRDRQKKLAAAMMHGAGNQDPVVWAADLAKVEKEVEQLEATVSEKSEAYRIETQRATVAGVQAMLPSDAMYVEFVRRRLAAVGYFPKGTSEQYLAYVLGPTGSPKTIDLGDAAPIDDAVFKLREALSEPTRTDAKKLARALDEKVMQPIRSALGASKRLIISPDGTLNFIPFEALVDEKGQFLIERWSMSYVTSGRDVFRWSHHVKSRSRPLIMANPAFGDIDKSPKKEGESSSRGGDRTGISRLGFTPLSGTAEEGRAIMKQVVFGSYYSLEGANKQKLFYVAGPKILHIATHGFFMGDESENAAANTRGFTLEAEAPPPVARSIEEARPPAKTSPLLRSGLALAGANVRGKNRSDGILTALEASGLDLEGTKLVVLSACETGLGQLRSGEGVEGLRRAFVLAGAETTVMSLWKVDDSATRDMMIGYYQRLELGEGRSEALRQVRLGMLANDSTTHPFYWASFIVAGDPTRFDGTMPPSPPSVARGPRGCACIVADDSYADDAYGSAILFGVCAIIGVWRRRRLS